MTTYAQKSSAQRAAKKAHGDAYQEHVSITQNEAGQWEITPIGKALKAFIADAKPSHEPVAPFSAPAPIAAPIQAPAGWESIEAGSEVDQSMHLNSNRLIGQLISDAADAAEQFGEDELERFAEEQRRKADEEANAQAIAEANQELVAKGEWVHRSVVEKPTKRVWHIADEMVKKAKDAGLPPPTRSEVQNECVRQGIASGTARTQYQHWFKACREAAAAPIATINKDGSISYPGKQ